MPQQYLDKIKRAFVIVGHERTVSSQWSDKGTLIICAVHGYSHAREVLRAGKHYQACRGCIEDFCKQTWARTRERPRGLYVDLGPPEDPK